MIGPQASSGLDHLRSVMAAFPGVEAGASVRDGVVVARLVAYAPERLRAAAISVLEAMRGVPMPRGWR